MADDDEDADVVVVDGAVVVTFGNKDDPTLLILGDLVMPLEFHFNMLNENFLLLCLDFSSLLTGVELEDVAMLLPLPKCSWIFVTEFEVLL